MSIYGRLCILGFLLLVLGVGAAPAQPDADSVFRPRAVWPAQAGPQAATDLRTGAGTPGPSDWQNHADYTIDARLDTSARSLSGTVTIQYTNNSPSPLSSLWLLVGSDRSGSGQQPADGIEIQTISVTHGTTEYTPTMVAAGTRRQVRLREPVAGGGNTAQLTLSYTIPLSPDDVPGWAALPSGDLYGVGRWYPRVAAYSSQHGWAAPPTRASLAEYGSFNYAVTVPARLIVAGSGTLMNPNDVLTADQRRRLMRARDSQQKVAIIPPGQAGTPDARPQTSGTMTWQFQMNGVRDVAWAASPAFIWNGAQFPRPGRRDGLAMSYYPPSAMGGRAWNRSTYHTQKAVAFYSKTLYAYPWNNAVSVTGPGGGRAFPGLSLCPQSATGATLFGCTVRNQSYNWFPGIVGSNRSRHPWMANGLRSFVSTRAHRHLYDGEFSSQGAEPIPSPSGMTQKMGTTTSPILAPSSLEPDSFLEHDKPAFGLQLLRGYILGAEQFDYALRQYVRRWAFRVSRPRDFFRALSDASGDDLSWFWTGWYASTWSVDLSVTSVSYRNDTPKDGAKIEFSLHQPMPMPVRATVVESDGDTHHLHLPVEVWRTGPTHTDIVNTNSPLDRITIDPDEHLPDANRANNTWTAPES